LVVGCDDQTFSQGTPSTDAASPPVQTATDCGDAGVPPASLECTGLYSDLIQKQIAPGVRAFAPAIPLWSDGADKQRWVLFPAGTRIDASNPSEWKFPIGTKVWKEFSVRGKRIETRLFEKVRSNLWVHAAYAWNDDESEAPRSGGGDTVDPNGDPYHIPTRDECEDCHRGRTDRMLGLEEVSLGLPGATGLTLETLVAEGLISPAPARTSLSIGDDGTGLAAQPLGWLHINCGTTCHNGNSGASAYGARMNLRLDPTLLDGRSSADFDTIQNTLNVAVRKPNWRGQIRITPGDPDHSLLVTLIANRGTDNPASNQMPPIATRLVDEENTRKIVEWIRKMQPTSNGDAGVHDSAADTSSDAGADDASPDAGLGDAGPP
jgi:hypothetical protein